MTLQTLNTLRLSSQKAMTLQTLNTLRPGEGQASVPAVSEATLIKKKETAGPHRFRVSIKWRVEGTHAKQTLNWR